VLRGLHNGLRHLLRGRNHTTSGRRMSLSALQHTYVPERRAFWHVGPLWNSGRLFLCPKPGERHSAKTSRVREHGPLRSVRDGGKSAVAWSKMAGSAGPACSQCPARAGSPAPSAHRWGRRSTRPGAAGRTRRWPRPTRRVGQSRPARRRPREGHDQWAGGPGSSRWPRLSPPCGPGPHASTSPCAATSRPPPPCDCGQAPQQDDTARAF
jgi:hypothetical protein